MKELKERTIEKFMGLRNYWWIFTCDIYVPEVFKVTAMYVWILKDFFDGIPWELEWAALVDGCSKFQVWKSVLLPIIKPGISAIAIFSFMSGWGEWLIAYTYLRDPEYYTFPVLLSSLVYEFRFVNWGLLAAMSLFYIIPTLIMYALTQKTLLKLQLVGAVKG